MKSVPSAKNELVQNGSAEPAVGGPAEPGKESDGGIPKSSPERLSSKQPGSDWRWAQWLLVPMILAGFLVWDLMPYLAIRSRGSSLEREFAPGVPLAKAEAIARSRGFTSNVSMPFPDARILKVQQLGRLVPVEITTGSRLMRVDMVPMATRPWTEWAAVKAAKYLPCPMADAIRTSIDNVESLDRRGTPIWQLYEVTSGTIRRRLN